MIIGVNFKEGKKYVLIYSNNPSGEILSPHSGQKVKPLGIMLLQLEHLIISEGRPSTSSYETDCSEEIVAACALLFLGLKLIIKITRIERKIIGNEKIIPILIILKIKNTINIITIIPKAIPTIIAELFFLFIIIKFLVNFIILN